MPPSPRRIHHTLDEESRARWQRASPEARWFNFSNAVGDVHALRMRCVHLRACLSRMYETKSHGERLRLLIDARAVEERFPTTLENDGENLWPREWAAGSPPPEAAPPAV